MVRTPASALLLLLLLGRVAGAEALAPGQPLTHGVSAALIARGLADGGLAGPLEVVLEAPPLPLGNPGREIIALEADQLRHDPRTGRFSALLVGRVGSEIRFRLPAHGRVMTLVEVPVLARALAPGERVAAGDLDWRAVRPDRLPPGSLTLAGEVLGAEAKRRLAPGRVLRAHDLGPPQLVRRGRPVRLVYAQPGLRITGLGTAQDDGAAGERVRVVNPASRRQVEGIVSGEGEVTVGGTGLAGGAS